MKQITEAEKKALLSSPNSKQFEYRTVEIRAEIRKEENGKKGQMILRGYPILFNEPSIIRTVWGDEITEVILPTALDRTELRNVYLLVGHNPDNLLGRSGVNMRLEVDERGLFFECELPNTDLARSWYNLIEQGICDGMSFGFTSGDQINWETMTRTITDISKLYEITITPFPAYELASVIAKQEGAVEDIEQTDSDGEKTEEQTDTDEAEVEKVKAELEEKLKQLEDM